MTHPPELVEMVCARCGTVFTTYRTPVAVHDLEPWSGRAADASMTCPECGARAGANDVIQGQIGPHPSRDVTD